MACGTGKTLTSLAPWPSKLVGVWRARCCSLVPSINLLSQAVKAWANAMLKVPLATFAVCSDTHAGETDLRRGHERPTTWRSRPPPNARGPGWPRLQARVSADSNLTAVFSTYQSIDVITHAQEPLGSASSIWSSATKPTAPPARSPTSTNSPTFHQGPPRHEYVNAAKLRLYMTATPRVYGDQSQS
jgi:predicted helicase